MLTERATINKYVQEQCGITYIFTWNKSSEITYMLTTMNSDVAAAVLTTHGSSKIGGQIVDENIILPWSLFCTLYLNGYQFQHAPTGFWGGGGYWQWLMETEHKCCYRDNYSSGGLFVKNLNMFLYYLCSFQAGIRVSFGNNYTSVMAKGGSSYVWSIKNCRLHKHQAGHRAL
jgi:hypothetical protein